MSSDAPALIPAAHLPICKMGQGAECCRYLVFSSDFACAKRSSVAATIDARVETMNARGDNCDGIANDDQAES